MTPALLRARKKYFWRNAAAFTLLFGISGSIYAYIYKFLAKDEFDEIPIPPISEEDLAKLRKEYEEDQKKKKKV